MEMKNEIIHQFRSSLSTMLPFKVTKPTSKKAGQLTLDLFLKKTPQGTAATAAKRHPLKTVSGTEKSNHPKQEEQGRKNKEEMSNESSFDQKMAAHNGKGELEIKATHTSINFDKDQWVSSLNPEAKELLKLEIENINDQWLSLIYKELTAPYFLSLKKFLKTEAQQNKKVIFPAPLNIYSFTKFCPDISKVKVLILGQDPYHNYNQAHGLAFSVLNDKLPPSLRNIYKAISIDYPGYSPPKKSGNLSEWCKQGVLLLNTCLTVEAHKANSHNNKGWEQLTSALIKNLINFKNNALDEELVILAWGSFAINMIKKTINLDAINSKNGKKNLLLTSVHPSPLSASRGFFTAHHFAKSNEWIADMYGKDQTIDWCCIKD